MLSDSKATFKEISLSEDSFEEIEMTIDKAAIPLFIKLLTDMYPKPVEGTVREVISNAIDATQALPESMRKAIEVSSPSVFNPFFTVEDFGCGMSLQTLVDNLVKYGGSTKGKPSEDSNDEEPLVDTIGEYGLGSKAPLAYCNEFTVITTKDGITTKAIISRLSDKSKTRILYSKPTDLSNGTRVEIPVKENDFSEFKTAISSYSKFAVGAKILIDGVATTPLEDYIELSEVRLNRDEKNPKYGKAYILRSQSNSIISSIINGNSISPSHYILGGWLYENPNSSEYRSQFRDTKLIVEIKPKIVDFDPSRTNIISNDNSRALDSYVKQQLFESVDDVKSKIIKVLDRMSERELVELAASYIKYNRISFENDKFLIDTRQGSVYRRYNYDTQREIPKDIFANSSGFDPLEYASISESSLKSYSVVSTESNVTYSFYNPISNYDSIVELRAHSHKITENNSHILSNFIKGESKTLEQLLFLSNFHLKNSGMTLFTNVTEAGIKTLSRNRKVFSSNFSNSSYIAYMVEEPDKEDIANIEKLYDIKISVCDLTKTVKKIKELTKNQSKIKKESSDKEEVYLIGSEIVVNKGRSNLDEDDFMNGFNYLSYKRYSTEQINLTEAIKEKNISFLITERYYDISDVKSIIIGLINAGLEIPKGEKVFVVSRLGNRDGGNPLTIKVLNLLKDYDKAYVSSKFNGKTKPAKEIIEKKTYSGQYLESSISSVNRDIALKFFLRNNRFYIHCRDGLEHLKLSISEPDLKEMVNIAVTDYTEDERVICNDLSSVNHDKRLELFKEAIDEKSYLKINAFCNFMNSQLFSSSVEKKIISTVMCGTRENFTTELEKMVLDYVGSELDEIAKEFDKN